MLLGLFQLSVWLQMPDAKRSKRIVSIVLIKDLCCNAPVEALQM